MSIPSSHYGIKSLQQMRVPKQQTSQNSRLVNKITRTNDYFLEQVDPLVGGCISFLLSGLPDDVPAAMHLYFSDLKLGVNRSEFRQGEARLPKKEQKVYLATMIGPVIAKLINRIAFSRPVEVLEYLIAELAQMSSETGSEIKTDWEQRARPETAPLPTDKSFTSNPPQTSSCSKIPPHIEKIPPRTIQLAVLGLGAAGKTSILNLLQGEPDKKTRPTIGFTPITMMLGTDTTVRFYDLGGGEKIRDIWSQYFYDVHGFVYVIDAAAVDGDLHESGALLNSTMQHPLLQHKPVLVVANKQDLTGSLSAEGVRHALQVPAVGDFNCVSSTAVSIVDPARSTSSDLEQGIEWLVACVHRRFDELNSRLARDTALRAVEDANKRMEKERRVLRNKIAAAFPSEVNPAMLPEGAPSTPEDVFSRADGLAFLAGEVGVDVGDLPPDAVASAEAGGFQRLVLQIIGAFNVPVSKKKTPMPWSDILALIRQLRVELGLSI